MYVLSPRTQILLPYVLFLYKMRLSYLCLLDIIVFYKREKCINSGGNVISFDIALDHPHSKIWKPIILNQDTFKSLNKAFAFLHILYCLVKTTWVGCGLFTIFEPPFLSHLKCGYYFPLIYNPFSVKIYNLKYSGNGLPI